MMGDIITDLGAAISGGLGIAASGNIHPGQVSMFEPIHGSAPKHAGKGLICPLAAIAAAGMMIDYLGHEAAAARLDGAVTKALTSGEIRSLSTSSGIGTSRYTDIVLQYLS
jgi:3-isopropylmalate dehydrogenase